MSIQPEDFLSQSPSAFLEQPGFLETAPLAPPQPKVEQDPNFMKVAIGIAAAVVLLRVLMKTALNAEQPKSAEEIDEAAKRIYKRILPAWLQAAIPAVAQAYQLGATESVTYAELEKMASAYAAELGDYVHQSSILALTEGFNAQINAGWSERLAWARVTEGYGLDSSQMRSYVKGLMSRDKDEYLSEPIPAAARAAVDRAFLTRADRLGTNEAFKASQVGRNVVWLSMQASGQLPDGTMKRWVTADDERVCVVCGPLHMVTIPLHRRFESNGQYFYAPGVHPNCRCEIELVYPELGIDVVKAFGGDPFDRESNGRFAVNESRKAKALSSVDAKVLSGKKVDAKALGGKKADAKALRGKQADAKALGQAAAADEALAALRTASTADALSAAKTADMTKLASLVARAKAVEVATEKESEVAVEAAGETKRKAKKTTQKRVKTLKPSDPQMWKTTLWVPGDLVIRDRDHTPGALKPGFVIDFTTRKGNDKKWAVRGFEDTEDIGSGLGDGFDDAFSEYMNQEGAHLVSANLLAANEAEKRGGDVSDPKELARGREGYEKDWALALSARDKGQLLSVWNQLITSDAWAYAYLGDPPDPGDATATEIAKEILQAAVVEAEENHVRGNERAIGRLLDDRVADMEHTRTQAILEDELIHDRYQMLSDDATATARVEPVFFRIAGWYGTRAGGVDGNVTEALAMGKYRVTRVSRRGVPEPLREHYGEDEIAMTIKNTIIVDLELEDK